MRNINLFVTQFVTHKPHVGNSLHDVAAALRHPEHPTILYTPPPDNASLPTSKLKPEFSLLLGTCVFAVVFNTLSSLQRAANEDFDLSARPPSRHLRQHAQAQALHSDGAARVAFIFPFHDGASLRVRTAVQNWQSVGNACSPREEARSGLYFYSAKEETDDLLQTLLADIAPMRACFNEVALLSANLSVDEEGYPSGPNFMFYHLFGKEHLRQRLRPYSHAFWIEWDVQPVRALWIDSVVELASGTACCWMSGSPYVGRGLDSAVTNPKNSPWLFHLNGNALYELHNEEFTQFLELVKEREPPGHYWHPFDIAIWTTLTSIPYAWHLYQAYSSKFCTTRIILNYGYHLRPEDVTAASTDASVFLIHGSSNSSGAQQLALKFNRRGDAKHLSDEREGHDDVLTGLRISVFIRSYGSALDVAGVVLESARRHLPEALEYVVVVPQGEVRFATAVLPDWVVVQPEKTPIDEQLPGALRHAYTTLHPDAYCTGDFIYHLNGDVPLIRRVLLRDLFLFGKPMVFYDVYSVGGRIGNATTNPWRRGTEVALGADARFDFSRTDDHLYPLWMYPLARAHLEATHGKSVPAFLTVWAANSSVGTHPPLFSEFNYLAAFLYTRSPISVSWIFSGVDGIEDEDDNAVPHTYSVVRPPITCAVNSWRFSSPGQEDKRSALLKVVRRAVEGSLPCEAVTDFRGSTKQR